ncbi:MAG: transcriptional repressor [Candidatus Mcinerneyibacterium aminivorans]|jgi:Fe2+ or Zn2+ uptake regulation protein|uniref:Transcriptional repressor n=1 Tax=Candidatus Mcinerneyibacterium aminivorans TaxID=2703815 RepID=A0A5D0MH03_9BACT|nr:MAG: transcriptional repressor [Candidatus Mcinerneyibacterium aminivorans]
MKKTKDILENNGINPSYQRLIIYKYLKENQIHPSIDRIYNDLKNTNPTLSKTTVYNTVKLFCEKDLLLRLHCDDKQMRYDINTHDHMHFKCTKCGKLYDINLENNLFDYDYIDNHKINYVHIGLKGICKNCLSDKKD